MVHSINNIKAKRQYNFLNLFLWQKTKKMPRYWIHNYYTHDEDIWLQYHKYGNQVNLFFGTSNGKMKYYFIGIVFTRNISLKQHVVKIIFSCLEISFQPVVFKKKILLWSCQPTLKFNIDCFLLFYTFKWCLFLQ